LNADIHGTKTLAWEPSSCLPQDSTIFYCNNWRLCFRVWSDPCSNLNFGLIWSFVNQIIRLVYELSLIYVSHDAMLVHDILTNAANRSNC